MKRLVQGLVQKLAGQKVVKNALWLYILQFVNTILPLVTLPYVTRILGASQYGVFSVTLNLVTYLQVLVEYGFGLSATRKVSVQEHADASHLFSTVFFSRAILLLPALLIAALYMLLGSSSKEENLCMLILAAGLAGYCIQVNWLFQGKQDMKYISIANVTARVITTVLIFLMVKEPQHIVIYCFLYAISPVISNCIGLVIARQKYRIKLVSVRIQDIVESLKEGSYVFFTQLSSKVFGAIGVTFLGFWAADADVGIYSAINKIPYVLILLWGPISQILYPISSKKLSENFETGVAFIQKMRKYIMLVFGAVCVVLCLLSQLIIDILFGSEYSQYHFLLYPQLLWLLTGIYNNFLGTQLLVGSGHDKEYAKCFQLGVAATIVLNCGLIYFAGIYGASFAPLLSELILTLLLNLEFKRVRKNMKEG